MSHPTQQQLVNILGSLAASPNDTTPVATGAAAPATVPGQPGHPTWCARDHADSQPIHAAFLGEIAYGPQLTVAVEIYDSGDGPRINMETYDASDNSSASHELPAQASRDLAMLLAAGADILSGVTGEPLDLGVQR